MNRYIELESYIQQYCFDRMNVKWEYIDKPKLKNRMVSYAKHKDEESFRAELERIQKKLGLDREIHRQVQLQLSKILIGNICDSIFMLLIKRMILS